jgi:hypothetical protein
MASIYKSDLCTVGAGISPKKLHAGLWAVLATFEAAVALVVNDVIQMVPVQAGTKVVGMKLISDDIDSGTGTVILDVGDDGDTDRFIDGSAVGAAGGSADFLAGLVAALPAAAVGYEYAADNTIDILVQVAPNAGGTGTLKLLVLLAADL